MDSNNLKILAIDDHEDYLMALKAVLADGFPKAQIFTALNGREGIELAVAQDPDVILLDLVMPEMDGYEVCRKLKGDDRLRAIPVVILTALRTDRESGIKALEEGAEAFLSKPCDEVELIAQVRVMAKIKAAGERQRQEAQRLAVLVAERTGELEKELAERRKAEQELQQANQQLRRGQTTTLSLLEDLRREVDDRKRAEKALRDSEECFSTIFRRSPAGITVARLADEVFVDTNEIVLQTLGYSREELLGRTTLDLNVWCDPQERTRFIEAMRTQGRVQSLAAQFRGKSGGEIDVLLSAELITLAGEQFILTMSLDLTDLRRAEAQVQAAEAQYRLLAEHVRDVVWLMDLRENRFLYVSPSVYQLRGYRAEEVMALPVSAALTPQSQEDVAGWIAAEMQLIREGRGSERPKPYLVEQPCKDGSTVWTEVVTNYICDETGVPAQLVGLSRDISLRKQAEKTLQESEERFRRIFEEGPIGIAISGADFRFLRANAAFCALMGRSESELKVLTFQDFTHPEDLARDVESVHRLLRGEIPVYRTEKRYLRKGAEVVWGAATIAAVYDRDGQFQYFVVMVENVTKHKQVQERLEVHQRQLRELASELSLAEERERRRIAMALHDHTCQNLVLARMKIEELLAAASAGQAEAFRGVCHTLGETIEGVRELTFDLSSPTLYRFGLEAALEELLEDKFGGQDVECDFSDDHKPKPLTEDVRVLLFQSVREVLVNILKHARARKVSLDIGRTDGSIRITVTDDGVGFDVNEVVSLPARHHGFGLFSIKERLDCIGGTLEIHSQRGVGSRFILIAPLDP